MKRNVQIITVTDPDTLKEAITPYDLPLKGGGLLRSRIIKKQTGFIKDTYWIECRLHSRKTSVQRYQVEYLKTF